MDILNKSTKKFLLFLVAFIIVVPIIIVFSQHLLSFGWFLDASNDGWLGFWGGFLGSAFSIFGVYVSIYEQKAVNEAATIKKNRPSFSYINRIRLSKGEKIYFSPNFVTNPESGLVYKEFLAWGMEEILEFTTDREYDHLVSIRSVNKRTAYNCSVELKYSVDNTKEKIYIESFYVGLINMSNPILIVPFPTLHAIKGVEIKEVTIYFETDSDENGIAHFDNRDKEIINNKPEYSYMLDEYNKSLNHVVEDIHKPQLMGPTAWTLVEK